MGISTNQTSKTETEECNTNDKIQTSTWDNILQPETLRTSRKYCRTFKKVYSKHLVSVNYVTGTVLNTL